MHTSFRSTRPVEGGLQWEGCVGHAYARLARSRDIVKVSLEYLAKDPLLFLHPQVQDVRIVMRL